MKRGGDRSYGNQFANLLRSRRSETVKYLFSIEPWENLNSFFTEKYFLDYNVVVTNFSQDKSHLIICGYCLKKFHYMCGYGQKKFENWIGICVQCKVEVNIWLRRKHTMKSEEKEVEKLIMFRIVHVLKNFW